LRFATHTLDLFFLTVQCLKAAPYDLSDLMYEVKVNREEHILFVSSYQHEEIRGLIRDDNRHQKIGAVATCVLPFRFPQFMGCGNLGERGARKHPRGLQLQRFADTLLGSGKDFPARFERCQLLANFPQKHAVVRPTKYAALDKDVNLGGKGLRQKRRYGSQRSNPGNRNRARCEGLAPDFGHNPKGQKRSRNGNGRRDQHSEAPFYEDVEGTEASKVKQGAYDHEDDALMLQNYCRLMERCGQMEESTGNDARAADRNSDQNRRDR
jgi:hypothetical protein